MEQNLATLTEQLLEHMASSQTCLSEEEILAGKVESLNALSGHLTGYDCPLCRNRGDSAFAVNGEIVWKPCPCRKVRRSLRQIRESGLEPMLKTKTFASYQAKEGWQKKLLQLVQDYARCSGGEWLVLAGSPGAGKTHLCTAVCGAALEQGEDVRYMLWLDESQKLKAVKNDSAYEERIRPWKQASILYIDDLFKTRKGEAVGDADIRLAFELVNSRYVDPKKRTVISMERTLEEIVDLDEGLGGRLRERSKGFYAALSGPKDWRLL